MNWKLKERICEIFRTQIDFAQRIGKSESKVSLIVRGRRVLSPEDKQRWAKLLNCEIEDIFED